MMVPSTKVVQKHDFGRTDPLERVDLQALHGLLETFTRLATQKFTSVLRQPCSFEIIKVEQITWRDLVVDVANDAYFFTFTMAPLSGRSVFVLPIDEALALVDVRLAGRGEDDFTGRVPSEIDQAFLEPIMDDLLGELAKSVSRVHVTTPKLEAQDGNVQFVPVGSASEMFLVASLSVSIAKRATRDAILCLPFSLVHALIDSLQAKSTSAGESRESAIAHDTRVRLREVPLEVVFQFPSFVTTPAELLTLRVGDNLGLGHPKGRPLEVRAAGLLVALADICSSGVHKAFEIKEEVTK
ncbi:MAG: flagellar motor switch protein FliM [Acidimicrobiales bacterium]